MVAFIGGCDNATSVAPNQAKSAIDGKPILKVNEADYRNSEFFLPILKKIAADGGIVNQQLQRQLNKKEGESRSILLKEVFEASSINKGVSTHYKVEGDNNRKEDVVLMLEPSSSYIQNQRLNKTAAVTLITRSPDELALPLDAAGNEIWPVVLPTVVLGDPNTVVNVSFNSDGTTQIVSGALGKKSEVYDFVYVEDIYTDDPASPDQSLQWNGSFIPGTYLTLLGIQLEDAQETFGPAEVMMHVTAGDGSDKHANQASHFFDKNKCSTTNKVITGVDASGQLVTVSGTFEQCNAVSKGANGGTYLVPDVNNRETFYAMPAPYPIAALNAITQHAVMVEDNTDYKNFSWRSSKDWAGNVLSYNLESRIWESVYTQIAAKRHYFVSNDAVIPKSGITKIHTNSYVGDELIEAINGNMRFYFGKQTNN